MATVAATSAISPSGFLALLGIDAITPSFPLGTADAVQALGQTSGLDLLSSNSPASFVDISTLGSLLSASAAFQTQQAVSNTAPGSSSFDNLATATQFFVSAFNTFQASDAGLQNPLDALGSATTSDGASLQTSLEQAGITFQASVIPGANPQIAVDFTTLQSAFNTNPAGTIALLGQGFQALTQTAVTSDATGVFPLGTTTVTVQPAAESATPVTVAEAAASTTASTIAATPAAPAATATTATAVTPATVPSDNPDAVLAATLQAEQALALDTGNSTATAAVATLQPATTPANVPAAVPANTTTTAAANAVPQLGDLRAQAADPMVAAAVAAYRVVEQMLRNPSIAGIEPAAIPEVGTLARVLPITHGERGLA
ncbi:MAG: hypothetical protein EPO06_06405 [Burkholderiaceae bacterium]|nr:MAG: hypothetical protein EPO06_06405 [Burkholderiaceae bacterium]